MSLEKPINVNEGNEFEQPESEPAPVQRLVMQHFTFDVALRVADRASFFVRAPDRASSTEHIMNCAV